MKFILPLCHGLSNECTSTFLLTSSQNVPLALLFKICSRGSEIPNIFRKVSKKSQKKTAKFFKIFSRTASARVLQKKNSFGL
jgi:hypothetical protein